MLELLDMLIENIHQRLIMITIGGTQLWHHCPSIVGVILHF